jgi:Flp pilus assembly protein TadG
MPAGWFSIRTKHGERHTLDKESGEIGQSVVEMAIAFPVLLLLVLAVVDFARIIDAGIVLTNSAREGARYGSMDRDLTESDIQQLVVDEIVGSGTNVTEMYDLSTSNVTVEIGDDFVTVTITYDFGLWFGGVINMDSVTLTREAVMPILWSGGS